MSVVSEDERDMPDDIAEPNQRAKRHSPRAGLVGLAIGLLIGLVLAAALLLLTRPATPTVDLGDRWDEDSPVEVGSFNADTFWAGTEGDGSRTCILVTGAGPATGTYTCGDTEATGGRIGFSRMVINPDTNLRNEIDYIVIFKDGGSFSLIVESHVYVQPTEG